MLKFFPRRILRRIRSIRSIPTIRFRNRKYPIRMIRTIGRRKIRTYGRREIRTGQHGLIRTIPTRLQTALTACPARTVCPVSRVWTVSTAWRVCPEATAEEAARAEKPSAAELEALRKPVEEAKARLEETQAEAKALAEKARALVAQAKDAYRKALAPYREACRKAGATCEFEGGRSANVTEKVTFLVERTDKGVRVCVKGRPETEEVIPLADLEASINKAAYAYTDKHLGPREEIGNKGGSLSNRLRAAMA